MCLITVNLIVSVHVFDMLLIVSVSSSATSGDSGPQQSWKRLKPAAVKRGRKKSAGNASGLQQARQRRQEVDEDRETSPPESESSEQGEC